MTDRTRSRMQDIESQADYACKYLTALRLMFNDSDDEAEFILGSDDRKAVELLLGNVEEHVANIFEASRKELDELGPKAKTARAARAAVDDEKDESEDEAGGETL